MIDFLKKNIVYVLLTVLAVAFSVASAFGLGNFSSPSSFYQTGELESVSYYNSLCYKADLKDDYKLDSVWINIGSADYTEGVSEITLYASAARTDELRFYSIKTFENSGTTSSIPNSYESVKVGDWQLLCNISSSYSNYPYFMLSTKNALKINEIAFVGVKTSGEKVLLDFSAEGSGAKAEYEGSNSGLNKSGEFARTEDAKALAAKLGDEQHKFDINKIDFENYVYNASSDFTENEAMTLESVRNIISGRGLFIDLSVNPLGQYLMGIGISVFGATSFGIRIVPFLFSLLSLFAVFFIGEILTGKPVFGLAFSFLFAAGGYSLFFATAGRADAIFVFFILCAFYFAIKFVKKGVGDKNPAKGYMNIISGGVFFTFALSVKTAAVFYILPLIAVFVFGVIKQYAYAKSKGTANTSTYRRKAISTISFGAIGYIFLPIIFLFFLFLTGYGAYGAYIGESNVLLYGSRALWGLFGGVSHVFNADNIISPIGFIVNYSAQAESAAKFAFGNLAVMIVNFFSVIFCGTYLVFRFKEMKGNPFNSADGDFRIYFSLLSFALFGWLLSFTFPCGISEFYLPSVFMSGITVLTLKRITEEDKNSIIGKNITISKLVYGTVASVIAVFFALAVPAFIGVASDTGLFAWQVLSHTVL